MNYLNKVHSSSSKRDLASNPNQLHKNVNELSSLKSLTLNFSEIKSKKAGASGLAFINLLANKKGRMSFKGRRESTEKNIGCALKLSKGESLVFIDRFINCDLVSFLNSESSTLGSNFSEVGNFSFYIKDVFTFLDLGDSLFRFRDLENLNVSIVFSRKVGYGNSKLLRSLGFIFQKQ